MASTITAPYQTKLHKNEIIMTKELEIPDSVLITPIRHALQILKETSQNLERIHHHPTDNTIVGIQTSVLETIQVVVARTLGRQGRVDSDNVAEAAAIELDLAKQVTATLTPLAKKFLKKNLRSEDLVLPLQEHANPSLARRAFLSLAQTRSAILANCEILAVANAEPPVGKIFVSGMTAQKIRGAISELSPGSQSMKLMLTDYELQSPLFIQKDIGTRVIELSVPDAANRWLIAQYLSYCWEIDLIATIDVAVDSKALYYSGTLISVIDAASATTKLRDAFLFHTKDLFDVS